MQRRKPRLAGGMAALGVALASLFIGAALVAAAGAQPLFVAGLDDASASLALQVRHRFRHHRPRHVHRSQENERSEAQNAPGRPAGPQPAPLLAIPPPAAKEAGTQPAAAPPEPMGPPPPPDSWTAAEVGAGRIDCNRRLSGLHTLFERLDPIKEGVCGLPAPIRLKGFGNGKEPNLIFSPQPLISCKLAEALAHWADDVIQPNAKAYLNTIIVGIGTLSAYSCRTRYDDPTQRVSQHAFANAVDVSEFITAKGERIAVLDGWNEAGERSAFLHGIHAGACKIFGTTLGPEANESHKNHFHLDMKERRQPLCDFTPEQLRTRAEAEKRAAVKVPVSGGEKPAASGSPAKAVPPAPSAQR